MQRADGKTGRLFKKHSYLDRVGTEAAKGREMGVKWKIGCQNCGGKDQLTQE